MAVPNAAPAAAHTGLMCAFVCPPDVADKIATVADGLDLPEGAKLLDKSDYHITLTFTKADGIGEWPADSELPDGMPAEADVGDDPGYRAAAFADEVLTGLEPLHGTITGFWRFSPSTSSDNASVLVLLIDVLGLVQVRELIVDALEQAGLQVSDDFAYMPHITVAYVPGEGSAAAVDRAIHPGNALLAENGVGPLVLDTFEVAYAEEPPILFTLAQAQEAAVQASELASLMFADDNESDFDSDADGGYSQPGSAPGGSGGFPPYGSVAFGFAFNLTNPEAVKWIDEHAALLVKEITDQQMSIIRQYLHESFVDGITPAATARRIRDVVGLTSNQAAYVENYLQRLKAANVPDLVQQKLASQYAQRWLNFRANTIARTETIRAAISGQQELWDQALDAGLINTSSYEQTWIVTPDDRLCPACRQYRNLRAPLGGVFPGGVVGPPLHPACRCAIGLVLKDSAAAQKVVPPPYGGGNGKPMAPKIPTQYMMSEEARVPAGSSRGGQFLSGRVSGNIPGAEIHEEDFKKTLDEAVERVKALGVKADFAGLDPATARTISYRVVDMLKMFPGIKSVLGSIEAKDFRKTAPEGAGSPAVVSSTLATTFTGKRTLRLNTAVLGLDGINSHTERSDAGAAAGWNAGGSGPVRRVVEHEFGHLAQYALEKNAAAVVSEFYRAYLPEMSSISRYASSRPEEAWAEAFCESFGHAPPVSQRLRQVVESHLSK